MLSQQALAERMWGPFPALRQALESEQLPDHYFGLTSVSDNIFERFNRTAQLALLVREHRGKIKTTSEAIEKEKMHKDLERVESLLQSARSFFDEAIEEVQSVRRGL